MGSTIKMPSLVNGGPIHYKLMQLQRMVTYKLTKNYLQFKVVHLFDVTDHETDCFWWLTWGLGCPDQRFYPDVTWKHLEIFLNIMTGGWGRGQLGGAVAGILQLVPCERRWAMEPAELPTMHKTALHSNELSSPICQQYQGWETLS